MLCRQVSWRGTLKIISPMPVELADGNTPAVTAETYSEYPLIILNREEKKEITRVTADRNGNYRVLLPPGDYVLDVEGRARKHVRAKPQLSRLFPIRLSTSTSILTRAFAKVGDETVAL